MKLVSYDVTIIISDPNDEECELRVSFRQVPREKIPEVKMPLKALLEEFEATIVEDIDSSCDSCEMTEKGHAPDCPEAQE